MTPANDAQQFAESARDNHLHISVEDAMAIDDFRAAADAAYSTIREIDTTGFVPAAIFVPTPSGRRESD